MQNILWQQVESEVEEDKRGVEDTVEVTKRFVDQEKLVEAKEVKEFCDEEINKLT